MAAMLSVFALTAFAQTQNRPQLSEEQKQEMKSIHEKYAPEMKELKTALEVKKVEQQALLAVKEVDEKAIYANINATGKLKAEMHKKQISMHAEMQTICPNAGMRRPPMCNEGQKQCSKAPQQARPQQDKMKNCPEARQGKPGMQACQKGEKMCSQARPNNPQTRPAMHTQRPESCPQGAQKCALELTEEQKAKMEEIKKTHFWLIQETENELNLLQAKNKTADTAAQLKSVDKIAALNTQLAKQKMAMKLEMRKVLTEEQLIKQISKQNKPCNKDKNCRK